MTKRINENQIVKILDEAKAGAMTTEELCRKHGISTATYYNWKDKFDREGQEGLKPQYVKHNEQEISRLKKENGLLKQIVAEKELELQLKTELLKKKMQQWKNEGK